MSLILGIDIGGTTIKAGLLDPKGNLVEKKVIETPADKDNTAFLNAIWDAAESLIHPENEKNIIGIGIGAPGPPINSHEGTIIEASNMPGVKNAPVVPFLRDKLFNRNLDYKIKINNDANAAALGQLYFGKGKEFSNFTVVTLGTGVGGGLILNKRLFSGYLGNSFEIGHIPVFFPPADNKEDSIPPRQCGCGATGCLETIASATGISEYYKIFTGEDKSAKDIAEAARNNDPAAKKAYRAAADALAHAAATIVHLLNVEAIIYTGGLAAAEDLLKPRIEEVLDHRIYPFLRDRLHILFTRGDENSGITGAASLLFDYA